MGEAQIPAQGALLCLDYGTKRIGAAISTPEQSMSLPLENYERRTIERDAVWLKQLVSGYRIAGIVVGLPVHMSGDEGGKALEARQFGEWARAVTGLPVVWWDERYSSAVADLYLHQRGATKKKQQQKKRDSLAAQVILDSFLNAEDRTRPPGRMNSETER